MIRRGFPAHLLKILWNFLKGRKLKTKDGNFKSNITFDLMEGLQQGVVNSPILFNIYTADLLNMYDMNMNKKTRSIGFADDLIRNDISLALKNDENPLTKKPFLLELDTIDRMIVEGFLPLETFPRLDQRGFIQNNKNLPIIYHVKRHVYDKKLKYNKYDLNNLPNNDGTFDLASQKRHF